MMADVQEVGWLEQFYDVYPRIEDDFRAALDESLQPRGPELLYQLVETFELPPGAVAIDVGCGEGVHTIQLAERFRFSVTGLDPVPRHVELAAAAVGRAPKQHVQFVLGAAQSLPVESGTVDLVWCRDALVHVADLEQAYAEFQRVLRRGGRVVLYQIFGTDRLEPREAEWLWSTMGVVPNSAEPRRTAAAIAAAGLLVDECIVLGSEWGERAEEASGANGRRLLYAARLLRDPERYRAQFGWQAYEIMLGDCLWHVYAMIGKLERRVYLLSKP
jgi:SAM-dependent methyltransferase